MKQKMIKRSLTLLEVMVVIFIIGIIGVVIGVNMKGSLNEGKAFKSEKGSKQVYEILSLEIAKAPEKAAKLVSNVKRTIESSGLPQDAKKLMQDGWGNEYIVKYIDDQVTVTSKKFIKYLKTKKDMTKKEIRTNYPWMDPSEVNAT